MAESNDAAVASIRDLFVNLAAPFAAGEVKSRQQAGRSFNYITARTVMNRLDDMVGPENWWDTYTPDDKSVMCHLTLRLPDGSVITKADAGGYAGMADSGDDDKSGYSDAFKRAAVKFGIGRYLYRDGLPAYVTTQLGLTPESLNPPEGPSPNRSPAPAPSRQPAPAPNQSHNPNHAQNPPRMPSSGRGLFAWAKENGQIDWINTFGKNLSFPPRMVDWTQDEVAEAWNAFHGTANQPGY